MAKAFSIASWNVEHFKQDPTRVDRVIDFVAAQNPDMLALCEVESKEAAKDKWIEDHSDHSLLFLGIQQV